MSKILLPDSLTAENGAKKMLIGEFFETVQINSDDNEVIQDLRVPVSWTTIVWITGAYP